MSRPLYPAITPYQSDWLQQQDGQQIYYEQSGNPDGIPVVYLHGGPGAGSNENYRRYFDPERYRIILYDQRGCGRSRPSPSIDNNDCQQLIGDLEALRHHLSIERWLVAGGSWGSTLALLYGIEQPQQVLAFILRGIFLGSQAEFDWLYSADGAAKFFPEYYREFLEPLTEAQRADPLKSYHQLLNSDNELAAIAASKAWYLWESRLSSLEYHDLATAQVTDTHQALCMAKISSHYFNHLCFIGDDFIVNNLHRLANIPATVIHGRYDMVCQPHYAYRLCEHWPSALLQIMPCAGHSGFERQTVAAFCKAADTMATFLSQQEQ